MPRPCDNPAATSPGCATTPVSREACGSVCGARWALDRSTGAFLAAAGSFIVTGGIVAAVDSATPFGHGAWLAAYLVLVGGVSQVTLGPGRLALGLPRQPPRVTRAQLVLWNAGGVLVPAGVLASMPGIVTAGSVALLAALALFATGIRSVPRGHRTRTVGYAILVAGLAVSVVVGSALADAAPASWL
jgi:hypothetical protein